MITAKNFSPEILEKADILKSKLPSVPKQLDSPFFFARFLTANNGDVEKTYQKILQLFEHRQLLNYADISDLDIFTKVDIGKDCFERFNISKIDYSITSRNVHVFMQKMSGTDLKEILKVMPLSYVLHSYFMLQENFSRAMAHTERLTGETSSVVCVLDLTGLNLVDFMNPLSGPAQLARLVVQVWAEYFSEHLCKLLIINPPGIISVMWQVTKRLVDPKTAEKLEFLSKVEDLKKYLEPGAIPEEYGGTYRDDSGYADPPEGVCRPPKVITKDEYKLQEHIWLQNNILKAPKGKGLSVKSFQTAEYVVKTTTPGKLVWSYTTSGDIDFEIVRRDAGKEMAIWPKITITSLKLPEYGQRTVPPGEYILKFANPSNTWFPVKITCAAEILNVS
uniref:CRAL-TRIO domain-containing protein n=1 Tax=Caenorhabditis japonica TaxID=281687 RepID=A0A8R1DZW7_CAEJA